MMLTLYQRLLGYHSYLNKHSRKGARACGMALKEQYRRRKAAGECEELRPRSGPA